MLSSRNRQIIAVALSLMILASVIISILGLFVEGEQIQAVLGNSFNNFVVGAFLLNEPRSQQYASSWKGKVVFFSGGLVFVISIINIGIGVYSKWHL